MRIVRPAALVLLLPALVLVPAVSSAAAQRKPSAKSMAKSTVQMVPMRTIAGRDQTGGGFGEILDLALDDHRTLYVCDARSADIRKFDDFGTLLGTIGRKGSGSGELDRPVEVEVRGDRVFVRDLGRSRMFVFDLEGRLVSSTPVDEREGRWRKFRALPDGRFVVERETAGETRLELCSAGFSPQKTLYRKAVPSNRISAGPLRKDIPLPFAPVVEWYLTPEGLIVAGYSGDYSLEILDPDKGRLAAWTRSFKPFEVTEKDRKDYLAGPGRDLPPAAARTLVFPKTKPAFEKLVVNGRGRIWTFLPSADPKERTVFEAFDADGTFRSRVILEDEWPRTAPVVFFVGGVWMAVAGPDGETSIVRYQITN